MITALTLIIALEHLGFLVLEMFLWQRPLGRRVFRLSVDEARITAVLAGNQGLYNGFLAAGLLWSLIAAPPLAGPLRLFFAACVALAGLYGGLTVSLRILALQAAPALLLLALSLP